MAFWKSLRRYLCTLPLLNVLIVLYIRCGNALPQPYGSWPLLALLLPGTPFLIGMLAGIFWGGVPGLRWRMAALYSLVSAAIYPLQYELAFEPGLFWWLLALLGGQQGVGFLIGAWFRMSSVRETERRTQEAASPDAPEGANPSDGNRRHL